MKRREFITNTGIGILSLTGLNLFSDTTEFVSDVAYQEFINLKNNLNYPHTIILYTTHTYNKDKSHCHINLNNSAISTTSDKEIISSMKRIENRNDFDNWIGINHNKHHGRLFKPQR